MSEAHYVGLMSGTSLDGIDAVAVSFSGNVPSVQGHVTHDLPAELRATLLDLNTPHGQNELERAAMAGVALARCYAAATLQVLKQTGWSPTQVQAIGCHGQTVRHRPELGFTLQLGNGALLAELTGITVVTDFRSRDIAAGGQGAPLVPAFHDAIFRSPHHSRIILNLGGIANLTVLHPGQATRGYDCGPANVLLDGWVERHLGQPFDRDGQWGRSGTISVALLQTLMEHPFFQRKPPKSTGRDEFHLPWLEGVLDERPGLPAQDVQATLVALTAHSVAQCIAAEATAGMEVCCCGGGAKNPALVEQLRTLLPNTSVRLTDDLGVPVMQVEATAFAWLARELLQGRHANLPAVTGAHSRVPLGAIYPA
jgi:anhydro-N-acetylmuramic acid kinase